MKPSDEILRSLHSMKQVKTLLCQVINGKFHLTNDPISDRGIIIAVIFIDDMLCFPYSFPNDFIDSFIDDILILNVLHFSE
jgi:hypothetical protein